MQTTRLGRSNLTVSRTAFGVLPLQRVPMQEAVGILRKAYDSGITFFDTARGYTDSEDKIGAALSSVRSKIVLATKSGASDRAGLLDHITTSLQKLKTDHVDLLQIHNPSQLPDPNDSKSTYAGLLEAKKKGMTRFIGISNHRLPVAREAIQSGLYDTLQFPLSCISSAEDFHLVEDCAAKDVGFIAMKPLCGGMLTDARPSFAVLRQYENVVPIWGIQREKELDELLSLEKNPPALDQAMLQHIEKEKQALCGDFCRACGYCLPCPADIPIPMAARMAYCIRRMPWQQFVTPEWKARMKHIENCKACGQCRKRCPYSLDPPALLKKMYEDYKAFCMEKGV